MVVCSCASRRAVARLGAVAGSALVLASAGMSGAWAVDPSPSATAPNPVTQLFSNRTPAIAPAISFPQGPTGAVTGTLTPVSPPSSPLTYTAPVQPARGTVSVDTGSGAFTYIPTATARHAAASLGGPTTDSFTVSVSDGFGGTTAVPVTVPIAPTNAPPVVAATKVAAPSKATGTVRGTVAAQDPDGDPLTFAGATTTAKGSVTVTPNGAFAYTPTAAARRAAGSINASNTSRSDSFTITINDGHGGSTAVPIRVPIR